MKQKGLTLITLLVLGCSAAFAQTYTFGFGDTCDSETFTVSGPFAAGTHVLTPCGKPVNGVLVGFKTNLPVDAGPVTGAVVIFADNTFDAEYEAYTGCQFDLVTKTKAAAKHNPKYGWVFYYSCSGGQDYVGNYGYLTAMLDASHHGGANSSIGGITAAVKHKR
jgi:hypothetical protein